MVVKCLHHFAKTLISRSVKTWFMLCLISTTTGFVGLVDVIIFCIGLDTLTEMRRFLNERLGESVTTIVNEFQHFFAIRRQRAFWVVHSMLDPRWCVVEAVVQDGCVTWGGEYADITEEYRGCFEGVIDIEDFFDTWIDTMRKYAISILDHCGVGASYLKPTVRRVPFGETECTEIEDYEQVG